MSNSSVMERLGTHSADAKVRSLVERVIAELKQQRFGRRTIELVAQDGVIVRGEVTERVDTHRFV